MEIRRTFVGGSMSKGLIVVVAVCAAAGLGAGGALVAKNLSGSGATVTGGSQAAPHALPLRQDNDYPVLANKGLIDRGAERGATQAAVQAHSGRRGGTIDDSASSAGFTANDGNGPDSDLTRVLPVSTIELPAWLQQYMTAAQPSAINVDEPSFYERYLASHPQGRSTGNAYLVP